MAVKSYLTNPRLLKLAARMYPPFWANGIRVTRVNEDVSEIDVRIRLKRWAANPIGTIFGGSLFTFCDPFYMIILLKQIGKEHLVWDRSTYIEFISPGRAEINYTFGFTPSEIKDIVNRCSDGKPYLWNKELELKGVDGVVVAKVNKTVYIRRKKAKL